MTKGNLSPSELGDAEEGPSLEQTEARARIRQLIDQRGIRPVTLDQLREMGDLWPQDENVDDFIAAVREWRRDGRTGSLR
ncbi:MAG TPA: hypothetical protein VNS63_23885 [Blastocatellia bacterium]|nr:hypothetical protein [Blastocatellia bacterium]